jgi:signal transduction histidine kinase
VLRDQGFAAALQALAEQVGATNRLRIDLDVAESEQLGETAQVALYTIIRELLDQAIRRGPPTRVTVSMKAAADGSIETRVTDDADPERRRRTFEAIEERVSQLHGTIAMSVEQEGTTVTVVLPAYATRR